MEFRRTTRADFALIQRWLRRPHVARYWPHDTSDERIEKDFGGSVDGTEPSDDFVVLMDGEPIGFIQRCFIRSYRDDFAELYALTSVPDGAITIDYYIGDPSLVGQGIGTRMVGSFTESCWEDLPEATAIIVAVSEGNRPSWRALEKAGYRRVAVGDMTPDSDLDDRRHVVMRRDRLTGTHSHSTVDSGSPSA